MKISLFNDFFSVVDCAGWWAPNGWLCIF